MRMEGEEKFCDNERMLGVSAYLSACITTNNDDNSKGISKGISLGD